MTKRFLLIIILIFGIFLGALFLPRAVWISGTFNSKEEIVFQVEKGWGSREIALNLENEGLIWWSPFFRIHVLISGKAGKLQAGPYFLSSSMNIPQIAGKIASGDIAKEKITIPEGFTSAQIAQKQDVTRTDRVTLEENEGYLFPDTYEIVYGTLVEEIIQIMRDNFNKKTAGLEITPEIVIMASLLEKEVKTKEEKELAAGVLWKRLRAGVPLQVDAAPETYERLGLPENPICNPGLESILAAVYPKSSNFWYYISKPDGETIFQKTLDEHNYAKAKYLK